MTKKLKELYPDAQILPLDYDPDVSFANIENRLQMLIMNAKQASAPPREVPSPARLTSPSRLAPHRLIRSPPQTRLFENFPFTTGKILL